MASKDVHDVFNDLAKQGYHVMINDPTVLINESEQLALVIFQTQQKGDINEENPAVMVVVDLGTGEVIEVYDVDWCAVACTIAAGSGAFGCAALVCMYVPPACGLAITLCNYAGQQGYGACYSWCIAHL